MTVTRSPAILLSMSSERDKAWFAAVSWTVSVCRSCLADVASAVVFAALRDANDDDNKDVSDDICCCSKAGGGGCSVVVEEVEEVKAGDQSRVYAAAADDDDDGKAPLKREGRLAEKASTGGAG